MRRCGEALDFATTIGRLGNPNAGSDVQVAIYMLRAGLAGAAENVEINLGSLKDAGVRRSACGRRQPRSQSGARNRAGVQLP